MQLSYFKPNNTAEYNIVARPDNPHQQLPQLEIEPITLDFYTYV